VWSNLLQALALVMVIEGLLPFLAPDRWRELMIRLCHVDSRSLRLYGGAVVAIGLVILQLS